MTILLNMVGRAGGMAVGLFAVPIYLRLLGLEGVGLIGFHTAAYGVIALGDHILSAIVMREGARQAHSPRFADQTRNLLRTLELFCGCSGLLITVGFAANAPLIVKFFLSTSSIDPMTLRACVALMGLAIAMQLVLSLHASMLNGIDRSDLANALVLLATVLRAATSILALISINRSIETYFVAQTTSLFFLLITSFAVIWRAMPTGRKPRATLKSLSAARRYLPAMIGNAIVFVIITQSDKFIVARMLSVDDLGRYFLASTIAGLFWAPLGPIHLTLLPRFSALIAQHAHQAVGELFHLASQFLSVTIIPLGVIAVLFPQEILFLWTGQSSVAAESAVLLQVLCAGTVLMVITGVPNALQLSAGWAHFSLVAYICGLIFVPVGAITTKYVGVIGPALIVPGVGLLQLIIMPLLLHRRILESERRRWYVSDVGVPLAFAASVGCLLRFVVTTSSSRIWLSLEMVVIWAAVTSAALLASVELRNVTTTFLRDVLGKTRPFPDFRDQ